MKKFVPEDDPAEWNRVVKKAMRASEKFWFDLEMHQMDDGIAFVEVFREKERTQSEN